MQPSVQNYRFKSADRIHRIQPAPEPQKNMSAMAPSPSKEVCWQSPSSDETASNRRPMLVVSGVFVFCLSIESKIFFSCAEKRASRKSKDFSPKSGKSKPSNARRGSRAAGMPMGAGARSAARCDDAGAGIREQRLSERLRRAPGAAARQSGDPTVGGDAGRCLNPT